ncbi:tetratricopeptide repeat protein, partial [Hyphomicrobium sp.]|uniref:O-linked N-acetylglucosamine transferase family protein n=1 Tax=Hyphomicrobium sp. TaxID=82 RepID=UPI002E338B27
VADQIRTDRIDILVDFGGHTSASRILAMARKPAPIQVAHFLGHGYTSGLSAMDVFLSDQEMAPVGSEALFAETVVRLPRIPLAYQPPEGFPAVSPLPALTKGYVTFGYFGRTERLNDRVVTAWAEILKRVPSSRLMLNSKAFSETAFADLMATRFAAHGITRDRLQLVYTSPQPKTWSAYGEVDIALDPFPHNAGTTTIEALWLGVPVVSVEDRPSVGRFGASVLGAAGLREWVATDVAGYVALAASKARDIAALAQLRSGLRARVEASPLADGPGLARALETAFRNLWERWCAAKGDTGDADTPKAVVERRAAIMVEAQTLDNAGRIVDAAKTMVRHLTEDGMHIDGLAYLSDLQRRLGRLSDAEATARLGLKRAPNSAAIGNALGNALFAQHRLTEAEAAFTIAITAKPGHAEAFNNRALVLMRRGQLAAAERDLRQALALRPDITEIGYNLANAVQDQGRAAEAIDIFQATLAKAPNHARGHGMMLFAVTYHPGLTSEQIFAEFRRWNEMHAARHAPKDAVWANDRTPDRRLRIGYVSPDFATKSSRHFIEPILVGHDPEKVEVFCYAEVPAPDAETHRLKALAQHWRTTVGLSDDELADLIRRDAIDVLVDLGGHTARNRLLTFARKPAPIQVAHFLGHGYTSGLSVMDAFLADDVMAPEGSDHLFSEPVERMSRMPVAYEPPQGMPDVAPLPALKNGYVTFGNFGRVVRLNDEVIATWAEILSAVPRSRLVLNTVAFLDEEVCRRYRGLFAKHGISADRVDMVFSTPQSKTWEAYAGIDIALDPFPHNGGTTTIEAAWLGVPSVCLKMRPSIGCFGASIMGTLGLSDWVASTRRDYVAMAIRRAANIEALTELRAGLRARMAASALCDARGLAKDLERVYRRLWQRYLDREEAVDTLQRAAGWAYGRGNAARAVELFQEAAKRAPRASILSNLGAALRAAGRDDEAEKIYREAIERAPGFPNAHGNLGNLLSNRGRLAEAEVELRQAHAASPGDPQILRNLGVCLMRQLKAGEAEAMLRKAAALLPNDGDIHDNLAQLLRQKGEPVAAVKVYEGVKDAIESNWRAIGNQALLMQDLSRYGDAEFLFRRALALKPDYALAHANLLFCLNYHPDRSAEEIFAEYQRF